MLVTRTGMRLWVAAILCTGLVATACGGSSSTTKAASSTAGATVDNSTSTPSAGASKSAAKTLPDNGCVFLTDAEVMTFIGSVPKCEPGRRTDSEEDLISGSWKPVTDSRPIPNVSAGVTRTQSPQDKDSFELEAGTKSYVSSAVKILTDMGDDAVLIVDPIGPTIGHLWILQGKTVIKLYVNYGAIQGDALAEAMTTTGRRLLAAYG